MLNIKNVDHFVLTVNNLNDSKLFYHSILDLPIIEETTDHVSLQCGSQLLRLRTKDNVSNSIVASKLEIGVFDFCLQSSDSIDIIVKKLQEKNQKIVLGPVVRSGAKGKMKSVYLRDPDNNLVEICSYK